MGKRIHFKSVMILLLFILIGCSDSKIRKKVDKDRASLRTLAVALDAYCMNWSIYPDRLDLLTKKIVYDPPVTWKGGKIVSQMGPFIDKIPGSAFDPDIIPRYFYLDGNYKKFGGSFWITWYPGPDGDFDLDMKDKTDDAISWYEIYRKTPEDIPEWILNNKYDPTNGTTNGDIIRWKS
jgi:hypothetical protein